MATYLATYKILLDIHVTSQSYQGKVCGSIIKFSLVRNHSMVGLVCSDRHRSWAMQASLNHHCVHVCEYDLPCSTDNMLFA